MCVVYLNGQVAQEFAAILTLCYLLYLGKKAGRISSPTMASSVSISDWVNVVACSLKICWMKGTMMRAESSHLLLKMTKRIDRLWTKGPIWRMGNHFSLQFTYDLHRLIKKIHGSWIIWSVNGHTILVSVNKKRKLHYSRWMMYTQNRTSRKEGTRSPLIYLCIYLTIWFFFSSFCVNIFSCVTEPLFLFIVTVLTIQRR